jgi:hypothetical protein
VCDTKKSYDDLLEIINDGKYNLLFESIDDNNFDDELMYDVIKDINK